MAQPIQRGLPWEPETEAGDTSPGIDVQWFMYPMYGGFQEDMRNYYPNYPTSYVNLGGFPYTDKAQYGGFLSGFVDERDKG
jgi:hypothetical protein